MQSAVHLLNRTPQPRRTGGKPVFFFLFQDETNVEKNAEENEISPALSCFLHFRGRPTYIHCTTVPGPVDT